MSRRIQKAGSFDEANVHVNGPLSNFAFTYMKTSNRHFATRLLPVVPVASKSDQYAKWDVGAAYRDEMQERGDGDPPFYASEVRSLEDYNCKVYNEARIVTDRARANSDPGVNLEMLATRRCVNASLRQMDKIFHEDMFKKDVWANNPANPEAAQRFDKEGSDVVGQVQDWVSLILAKRDIDESDVVIGLPHQVFNIISRHEDMLARMNRGQTTGVAEVTAESMAAIFGVGGVVKMNSIRNSGAEGEADNINFRLTDGLIILGRAASPSIEDPSAGAIFSWTEIGGTPTTDGSGAVVTRWYNPERRGWVIEVDLAVDVKATDTAMGVFVEKVLS